MYCIVDTGVKGLSPIFVTSKDLYAVFWDFWCAVFYELFQLVVRDVVFILVFLGSTKIYRFCITG